MSQDSKEIFPSDVIEAHEQPPKRLGENALVHLHYLEPEDFGNTGKGIEAQHAFIRDISVGVLLRIESTGAVDRKDMDRILDKFAEEDLYNSKPLYNDLKSVKVAFQMERRESFDEDGQGRLEGLENLAELAYRITSAMILNIKGTAPKIAQAHLQEAIRVVELVETSKDRRNALLEIIDETESTILHGSNAQEPLH